MIGREKAYASRRLGLLAMHDREEGFEFRFEKGVLGALVEFTDEMAAGAEGGLGEV